MTTSTTTTTPFSPPTVALKEITAYEVSVILENLSFSGLVVPFKSNGMNGRMINRISSYEDIMDFGICDIVAQTFYEDYVMEWQRTGSVPKILLLPFMMVGSHSNALFHVIRIYTYIHCTYCTYIH